MIRILYLFIVLSSFIFAQGPATGRAQPIDGFAAEVDGRIITVGDVVERIRPALMALRDRTASENMLEEQTRLFQEGLEQEIRDQLLLAKFRKLEAELPPNVVNERADLVMRQRFNDDRSVFQQALAAAGKTEQEWREQLKEQLIIQSMEQQFVRSGLHIAPREIRAAYKERASDFIEPVELEIRAIAFRPVAEDKEEERAEKIERVLKRVEEGEDFDALAREVSEGPKAEQGGYQGWMKIDTLPSPLPEVLQDLQPGDRTGLVDTPFQSYIFKVLDRRGGTTMSLAEAQPQLESELREQKYEEAMEAWIEGLKNEFQIQRFNPDISAVTGDR